MTFPLDLRRPLAAAQRYFDVAGHVDETWPDVGFQLVAREMKCGRAAIEGEHAVRRAQRHADRVDVALPIAEREGEAARLEVTNRALDRRLHLRPVLAFLPL